MEWYSWLALFGGTALFGAILVDIYARLKNGGKKVIAKKKAEKEQEERALIAEVVKEVMAPSCSNLQTIKDELARVKTDLEELKPVKSDILAIKQDIETIKTGDIKLLAAANRDSLRNQLLTVFRECKAKGYRTTEDIRNFEYMFESYRALGGNSFMLDIARQFDNISSKAE